MSEQAGAPPRPVAVVEIGSTGIRLLVAEILGDRSFRVLDRAGKPLALGRDVFTTGVVSRESIQQCLSILAGYRELLEGYAIRDEDVYCIATSALREADNRDSFADRVELKTGFKVVIVEGIEENRLMYLAVQDAIRDLRTPISRGNSLIIEVGGGSTEIMLLRRSRMVAAHSLRIGTIRIDQQVQQAMGSSKYLFRFLEENIRTAREMLSAELPLDRVKFFIAIGSDARFAAQQVGVEATESYWTVDRGAFERFVDSVRGYSAEEVVARFRVPYNDAEVLVPGLLVYRLFLEGTGAEQIIVPNASIREGMLLDLASGEDHGAQDEFYRQVIASAMNLGRKFHFDEAHAVHVSRLALSFFDQFEYEHGMGKLERLLLEVAGILHDIGTYVRTSGHHKHSEYIVSNSEIFGLHRDDIGVVSNVVRYHRKAGPQPSHVNYVSLPKEDRVTVLKLAAILRIADSLDRGHGQGVKGFRLERKPDSIVLHAEGTRDLSLERVGLAEKADIFEEVFGLKVSLV